MSNTTRKRILETLHQKQQCTIKELASALDITPISVRHHLTRLEADGLVQSSEERHGVGRPRRVYRLTRQGAEQFPGHYVDMTIRLLEQIKQNLPAPVVEHMFSQMAADLIANQAQQVNLEGLDVEERLALVQRILAEEGFRVRWEQDETVYRLHETTCPYLHVGENHPEVCTIDQTLISLLLQVPVEKIRCRLHGDAQCTYIIPKQDIPKI